MKRCSLLRKIIFSMPLKVCNKQRERFWRIVYNGFKIFFVMLKCLVLVKWGAFTRLETRTKESNRHARVKQIQKLISYWKGFFIGVHTKRMPNTGRPFSRLSLSVPVWTRKVVNYAWTRWSPGKPRWRPVAMLTCKSLAWFGYRSERLIEPPSSWFTSKFPSG